MKRESEEIEDRRELAAAKERNAGKAGTPLRDAAQELELDYLDVLDARLRDADKRRLSHDEVKRRYR